MKTQETCRTCGAALTDAAVEGLCPQCMLQGIVASPAGVDVTLPSEITEDKGATIDRYKLLEQLGEGGFGVVWVAEQRRPVRRRVALKIIKLGMDTKQVVARFEAERQALALMDHPNIAKVLDAGATKTGRPYFVMELVKGVPITEYCAREKLNTRHRLDLFIKVCHAIQHAHQKGIIHRDIKPSNIMITLHDGVPVPKVIDFGIAKATQQELTEKTVYTQYSQFIGTPAYMSPEQAEMSGLDIDTRSDVYGLGVLLYELLTGSTPFDTQELVQSGLDEMRKIIREREPVKPSTRLTRMQASPPNQIKNLKSKIPNDLDWIVMKCLEKDRSRRYETANELALDVQRHLSHEAVLARPPSPTYRFLKAWQRNKVVCSATVIVVLVLVVGAATSLWQANVAKRARTVAEDALVTVEQARVEAQDNLALAERRQGELENALGTANTQRERAERSEYIARMNLLRSDWQNNSMARISESLRKSGAFPERGLEWYLWQQRLHQDIRTLQIHTAVVTHIVFSPDGRQFATPSWDGTIKLWETASWTPIRTFEGQSGEISDVAFSPDGHWLLSGSSARTARIWEVSTGRPVVDFNDMDQVMCVAWSADGEKIALGGTNHELFVWDVSQVDWERLASQAMEQQPAEVWSLENPHLIQRLPYDKETINAVLLSSDGKRIVVAGTSMPGRGAVVRIWDVTTAEPTYRDLEGHTGWVRSLAFSADEQWLLSGGSEAIVWETATGKRLGEFQGHTRDIFDAAFSADGTEILTVGLDATVRIWAWDGQEARETRTLKGHHAPCWAARFMPDNPQQVISTGYDGTLRLWDLSTTQPLRIEQVQEVTGMAFLDQGRRLLTCDTDRVIRLWNLQGMYVERTFRATPVPGPATRQVIVLSPDEQWFVTVTDGNDLVSGWDLASGRERFPALKHADGVHTLTISPDGQLIATGCDDGWARLWRSDNGHEVAKFRDDRTGRLSPYYTPSYYPLDGVTSLTFAANGQLWMGRRSGPVTIWNVENQKPERVGELPEALSVHTIAFSPDGLAVATVPFAPPVDVWDVATGDRLLTLVGHNGFIDHISFSVDGSRILTGSWEGMCKLWETNTGQEVLGFSARYAALSGNGRRIAAARDNLIQVWTVASPEQVARWQAEEAEQTRRLEALRGGDAK